MAHDVYGNAISCEDSQAVADLNLFITQMLSYGSQAVRILDTARTFPHCALAQAYAATLIMFSETGQASQNALPYLRAAQQCPANPREALFIRAVAGWVQGDLFEFLKTLQELVTRFPRDLFSLKLAQTLHLLLGDFEGMLRLSTQALPAVTEVGYAHGMHAFALEQNHRISEAQACALTALRLNPQDPWAQHAYAHAQETQGHLDEGIRFMREYAHTWSECNSFMRTHNWWHLALFHLDRDEPRAALDLYDHEVWGVWKEYSQDQIGAVALLARLELHDVNVDDRWQALVPYLLTRVDETVSAFNDLHFLYGLARAGQERAVADKLNRFALDAASVDPYVRRSWLEVGIPAARGVVAAASGHFDDAVHALRPVMGRLQEIGGSHAQRDLFELIYLNALQRSGQQDGARTLLNKRIIDRPGIAWQHRWLGQLH